VTTTGSAVGTIVSVGVAAALLPAWRVRRVNPALVLRG
jgi:ABC-type antimicrobial peptide transport system permease subunit